MIALLGLTACSVLTLVITFELNVVLALNDPSLPPSNEPEIVAVSPIYNVPLDVISGAESKIKLTPSASTLTTFCPSVNPVPLTVMPGTIPVVLDTTRVGTPAGAEYDV